MPEVVKTCILCAKSEFREVCVVPEMAFGLPGLFPIVECEHCGLYITSPRPDHSEISAYYPNTYAPHTAFDWSPKTRTQWWKFRLKNAINKEYWVPPLPAGARVLEIGCGTGSFLGALKHKGWELHGVEMFSEPAELAAKRHGIKIHQGEVEKVDFPEKHFDAIFAWMVVEHLFDPVELLKKLGKSLRPGGYLVISIPNAGSWEFRFFRSHWFGLEIPRHLFHFTPKTIRRLLELSHFQVRHIFHQANVRNLTRSLDYRYRGKENSLLYKAGLAFLGPRWINFLLAMIVSKIRQSGRLTVVATAPQ